MDRLTDYVKWMGDFSIEATGFLDADALVLCSISYFYLAPVFAARGEEARVSDCLSLLDSGAAKLLLVKEDPGYYDLLRLAASSRRFGELRMADYTDILRAEPPLQFAALTFHAPGGLSFLAYRGTDSSLAGWREDFMISFTRTEAQEAALRYAKAHLAPGRRWIIGGHSKGGNLALFAAALLPGEAWARVERLYLLDGPGFCPEVLELSLLKRLEPRAVKLLPRFSVVGKLYEPALRDTRIVASFAAGFYQHGLISWGIDHGKLALAEEHDPASNWVQETLNAWIRALPPRDRAVMVTELFDALEAGGAESLAELSKGSWEESEAVLRRLSEVSGTTRASFSELSRTALRTSLMGLREKMGRANAKYG